MVVIQKTTREAPSRVFMIQSIEPINRKDSRQMRIPRPLAIWQEDSAATLLEAEVSRVRVAIYELAECHSVERNLNVLQRENSVISEEHNLDERDV